MKTTLYFHQQSKLISRRGAILPNLKSLKSLFFAVLAFGSWGLFVSSSSALAASDPTPRSIDAKFFGMHIHHLDVPYPNGQRSVWPSVPIGAWRLWSSYVNWYEIERMKGRYDFSRLDRYVALAEKNRVDVVLTLGRTPRWASARPTEKCGVEVYGCAAEPKNIQDWANYVRAVATRYKGRISAYEIWNEPAFSEVEATMKDGRAAQFYSGSAAKMVELARVAYTTIKEIDPAATVVSPSVTSEGNGLRRLEAYLKRGGGRWADVIGFHYYETPPEKTIGVTTGLRTLLNTYGLSSKPIWNTEMGYQFMRIDLGIVPTAAPKGHWQDIHDYWTGAGYVARALILAAANGIDRVYWFNWDGEPPHPTMGLAGFAGRNPTLMTMTYKTVYDWLVGSSVKDCNRASNGVWSCTIDQGARKGRLVWAEKGSAVWNPVSFPAAAYEHVGRADTAVVPGQSIVVTTLPILVKAEPLRWKK